jgi:hypothetical protein
MIYKRIRLEVVIFLNFTTSLPMSGSESRSVASGMHSAKEELYTNIITIYKLLVYEFIKVSSTQNAQSSDKDSYGFCQVFHQNYELVCFYTRQIF